MDATTGDFVATSRPAVFVLEPLLPDRSASLCLFVDVTVLLTRTHWGSGPLAERVLNTFNYVFIAIFSAEMVSHS